MERQEKNSQEYYTVDVQNILKNLRKRAWLIVLGGLLTAVIGFSVAMFAIAPTYSSSVKLYVNNTVSSQGGSGSSISISDLSAAQSLVRTYGGILDSRSTLERVVEKAGVDYTWKELSDMITYAPSNNTEIMCVTVTCEDPYEASMIANTIAEVLPVRISEIIEGASMKVVDPAVPDLDKVGPSVTRYTAIGLLLGVLLSVVMIVVLALMDGTVHDEEYVLKTYEVPILARIPNLLDANHKSYSYYSQKHQSIED
jgi:capsular polysaccharide biosynthesis protein